MLRATGSATIAPLARPRRDPVLQALTVSIPPTLSRALLGFTARRGRTTSPCSRVHGGAFVFRGRPRPRRACLETFAPMPRPSRRALGNISVLRAWRITASTRARSVPTAAGAPRPRHRVRLGTTAPTLAPWCGALPAARALGEAWNRNLAPLAARAWPARGRSSIARAAIFA